MTITLEQLEKIINENFNENYGFPKDLISAGLITNANGAAIELDITIGPRSILLDINGKVENTCNDIEMLRWWQESVGNFNIDDFI